MTSRRRKHVMSLLASYRSWTESTAQPGSGSQFHDLNGASALAEGEDVRLDTRLEECDLERAVGDRPGLAH